MKELAIKAFKFLGASLSVLAAAYTMGWSGAITLHNMFKTERTEAESFVEKRVSESEGKVMAIHRSDMEGIHGKMDILIEQNKLIISQNYRTRKVIESQIGNP